MKKRGITLGLLALLIMSVVGYILYNYRSQIFLKLTTKKSDDASVNVELRTPKMTQLVISEYLKQDIISFINSSPSTQGKNLSLQVVSESQHNTLDFGGDATWSYTIVNDESDVALTIGYNPDKRIDNSPALVQSELSYIILLALCDQQLSLSGQSAPLSERVVSCDSSVNTRIEQLTAASYSSLVSVNIN